MMVCVYSGGLYYPGTCELLRVSTMNEDFKLINLFSGLMISCRSTNPEIGLALKKVQVEISV